MMNVLNRKPLNIMSIVCKYTYNDIMEAVNTNNLENKYLRGMVNTCKNNDKVLFLIYKAYASSVLLMFQSSCVEVDGSQLPKYLDEYCKENTMYIFTYIT